MGDYRDEYASKGVAGTGLGLGIAGTALALMNNNGGGGLLGNLFGNGGSAMDELRSENALLKAQRYTDGQDLATYSMAKNAGMEYTDARFAVLAKEVDLASKYSVETSALKDQLIDAKLGALEGRVNARIDGVACAATNGLTAVNGAINCLQTTVANITKTIVPSSAVCPQPMALYNSWTAPTTSTAS